MNQQAVNDFVKSAEKLSNELMGTFNKAIENMTPEQAMEYQRQIQKLKQSGFQGGINDIEKLMKQFK